MEEELSPPQKRGKREKLPPPTISSQFIKRCKEWTQECQAVDAKLSSACDEAETMAKASSNLSDTAKTLLDCVLAISMPDLEAQVSKSTKPVVRKRKR